MSSEHKPIKPMTATEEKIWHALSPRRGTSAHDRTDRIAPMDSYQNAATWFAVPEGEDPLGFWRQHPVVGKWIGMISGSARVLDLGCGVGWPTFALALFAEEVIGIDASKEMIKLARKLQSALDVKKNVRLQVCDARELPFKDCSFVTVVSDNVLDVCDDQLRIAEEVLRVLRPDGHFALDFESFETALKGRETEEKLQCENYWDVPKLIYAVRTTKPAYLEREYILFLNPASQSGAEVISESDDRLGQLPVEIGSILPAVESCRYWESVHHDNDTMKALLSEAGFVDISGDKEGSIICKRPART